MKINLGLVAIATILSVSHNAHALQYDTNDWSFRLTGYGTTGLIEPDFEKTLFLGDWSVRGQVNYKIDDSRTFGTVYSLSAAVLDEDDYMENAFVFLEQRGLGRIELGFTDSVAHKLGLGLPDVGGMRVNEHPLFYKKIRPTRAFITDTGLTTGHDAPRINIVDSHIRGTQYGLSVAGLSDEFNYSVDAGLKIRKPVGKLKRAYSLSASFTDKPDGFATDAYMPSVTADWRAQLATAMNLQYNSWIWGINVRAIYDKNPIGIVSDGISAGTGISYDLLNYSISLSYILSNTGIWDKDVNDYMAHTGIASFRYKYNKYVNFWMSLGITTDTPFVSAALRVEF